jgi:hydroxymethylglutaryl-CoA reductase
VATAQSEQVRWRRLKDAGLGPNRDEATITDPQTVGTAESPSRSIENFIGTVKVPLGAI